MAGKQDRINQLKRAEKVHSSITGLGQKQIEQVNDYMGKLDNLISKEKERWSWGRKTRIQAADQAKEILNWEPITTLDKGIGLTFDYFKKTL